LRILQGAWTFAFRNCVQRWKQTPVYSCKNNNIIIVLDRKMENKFLLIMFVDSPPFAVGPIWKSALSLHMANKSFK